MVALAIALGLSALCAWDGWRRMLAVEAAKQTDLDKRLAALDERLTKLEGEPAVLRAAIENGVREMRGMLKPLQQQVTWAQQQRERS